KDRRLPISRFSEQRALLVRRQLLQQRPAGEEDEELAHLLDRSAEDRLIGEKLASHRPPLLAHARANEDGLQGHLLNAADRAVGALLFPQKRFELLDQLGMIVPNDGQTKVVMGS